MLGPLRWSMPNITKSDAKLSEMKKTSGTFFPGNALFTIFQHKVLQGSVATYVNYGRIFIDVFY